VNNVINAIMLSEGVFNLLPNVLIVLSIVTLVMIFIYTMVSPDAIKED